MSILYAKYSHPSPRPLSLTHYSLSVISRILSSNWVQVQGGLLVHNSLRKSLESNPLNLESCELKRHIILSPMHKPPNIQWWGRHRRTTLRTPIQKLEKQETYSLIHSNSSRRAMKIPSLRLSSTPACK